MSCQDMDALGMYMEFPSKLDPFMNDDMKDLWDSDLEQVNCFFYFSSHGQFVSIIVITWVYQIPSRVTATGFIYNPVDRCTHPYCRPVKSFFSIILSEFSLCHLSKWNTHVSHTFILLSSFTNNRKLNTR